MLIIHAQDPRRDSFSQVFSISFYTHFKCPVRPGLARKRCVVMLIIIAAGDAGVMVIMSADRNARDA